MVKNCPWSEKKVDYFCYVSKVISEKLKEFSPKATEADQTSFITQLTKAIEAKKVLEVGKVQQL